MFQQSDLDALEKAIKNGRIRVKYGDKEVTYRSLDEMMRIRDIMKGELSSGSSPRKSVSYASFTRD